MRLIVCRDRNPRSASDSEKEISATESADAKKLFAKLKAKPELATGLSAKGLPERTSFYKVYATTANGARRLLFFYRRPAAPVQGTSATAAPERWVLLFYRDKNDVVGKNMSPANPNFETHLGKNFALAIEDLAQSTTEDQRYDIY